MSTFLVVLVRLYQWTLRPFIGAHCRFEPSCSEYAIEALR
ncbi:MAG TPA: membrane protein insertion efficiency factor YidD, partial [Acetobacteraceae bacterium]|nr:membrane protein insertion efficiency factor YidD [Acetobacteraceae bacterium]